MIKDILVSRKGLASQFNDCYMAYKNSAGSTRFENFTSVFQPDNCKITPGRPVILIKEQDFEAINEVSS